MKGGFKEYPHKYEKVFSNDNVRGRKKFSLRKVSVYRGWPDSTDGYAALLRESYQEMERRVFDSMVKCVWLERRFKYGGQWRRRPNQHGFYLDWSFGVFMRRIVGHDNRMFTSGSGSYTAARIVTYFDDFFPNFMERNPFEEKHEFPYSSIGLGHLMVVHQMRDVRLDLLRVADERGMPYAEFLDWVLNWILCHNEELSKDRYSFIGHGMSGTPYVQDLHTTKGRYLVKKNSRIYEETSDICGREDGQAQEQRPGAETPA